MPFTYRLIATMIVREQGANKKSSYMKNLDCLYLESRFIIVDFILKLAKIITRFTIF